MTENTAWPKKGVPVEVPAQQISERLKTLSEGKEWLKRQRNFWEQTQRDVPQAQYSGQRIGLSDIYRSILASLQAADRALSNSDSSGIDTLVDQADRLALILEGGTLGDALMAYIKSGDKAAAAAMILAFNTAYIPKSITDDASLEIGTPRALVSNHPATRLLGFAVEINNAAKEAKRLLELSSSTEEQIEIWRSEIETIRRVYEANIKLRAPSKYWASRKMTAYAFAAIGFCIFLGTIYLAGWAAYWYAGPMMDFVDQHSGTELTWVGSFVAVAVPVAAVAWILRHVSRFFVQSLNTANDASFRQALVVTYLSIVQDLEQPIDEKDRALILNALFRPGPLEPKDEGPPIGLIEFLRGGQR